MIYRELKKPFILYLIAGIVLSAIIVSVIVFAKYEKSLLDTKNKLEFIRINASKAEQASIAIDSAIKRINSLLPSYYYSKSHKEIILLALDDIKTTIRGADIAITNFDDKAGEMILPVNISISVNNYVQLVNNIGYLQSLSFPYFDIENMVIENAAGKPLGGTICKIEGSLRMPAERLRGKK